MIAWPPSPFAQAWTGHTTSMSARVGLRRQSAGVSCMYQSSASVTSPSTASASAAVRDIW
jgi:hypothetical protein